MVRFLVSKQARLTRRVAFRTNANLAPTFESSLDIQILPHDNFIENFYSPASELWKASSWFKWNYMGEVGDEIPISSVFIGTREVCSIAVCRLLRYGIFSRSNSSIYSRKRYKKCCHYDKSREGSSGENYFLLCASNTFIRHTRCHKNIGYST